jgi:drug/metabolite transporter (DMT)-like permease
MIVPPIAVAAAMGSACLHAAWNVGIRGASDRRASTALLALASAVIGVALLPLLPAVASAAWPHLAFSAVLHTLYFNLVAEAYSLGAVSLTYPVMRGVAPALTATIAALGFGERLGTGGWGGLLLISLGVSLQAQRSGRPEETRPLLIAVANSVIVALYTVNDGLGARVSHSPVAYAIWTFVLPAIPAAFLLVRGRASRLFVGGTPSHLLSRAIAGGLCSMGAYALTLWAMTRAPIGAIAALRETAMLFGVLFAWWFLAESPGRRRVASLAMIAIGAVVLDLA